MRQDFAMLAPLFDRWIVTDRAVAAHEAGVKVHHRFTTTGRLLRLRDYQLATVDLRRLLARAPDEVLPTPPIGGSSFVIDCRSSDDGEIYARIAELEAGS